MYMTGETSLLILPRETHIFISVTLKDTQNLDSNQDINDLLILHFSDFRPSLATVRKSM